MRAPVAVLACLALLAGCASTGFTPSGSQRFPPHEGPVEVLQKLPAAGSYDLLGVVTVRGVKLTRDDRMFDQLKERAAEHGADAVVPQGGIHSRPTSDAGEDRTLAGYAIRRH